jgi:tryptophan 5-monooxygenase
LQCYFFTVEFGLCIEDGHLRIFGAGLLSSVAELRHVIDGVRQGTVCVQRFNVEDAINTQCVVTSFQKRYFFTESIEQAKEELR